MFKKIIVILIFIIINNSLAVNLVNADSHASLVKKVWLGVEFQTLKDSVVIVNVTPKSPAEKYGLKVGDFFTSIDEKKIKIPKDIVDILDQYSEGDTIEIKLIRDKKKIKKKVVLSHNKVAAAIKKRQVKKSYSVGFYTFRPIDFKTIKTSMFSSEIIDKYKSNDSYIITCVNKSLTTGNNPIKPFDEVIKVNDQDVGVKNYKTHSLMFDSNPGKVEVTFRRNNKTFSKTLKVDEINSVNKGEEICTPEFIEFSCDEIIFVPEASRPKNYWEKIFKCLDKNNAPVIPFSYYNTWLYLDAIRFTLSYYTWDKESARKINYYLPKAENALEKVEEYLVKNKDKEPPKEYLGLLKSIANAYKFAQDKKLKREDKIVLSQKNIER